MSPPRRCRRARGRRARRVVAHHGRAARRSPACARRCRRVSARPSHSSTCSMPWNSATSVPGWICRCRSAHRAVSVRRGSTTIHLQCRVARARASSIRRNRIGCAQAVLRAGDEEHSRVVEVLVAGTAARRRRASACSRRPPSDMHRRELVSMLLVPISALGELVEDVVVLGQQLARDVEADRVGAVLAYDARRSARRRGRARRPSAIALRRVAARGAPQRRQQRASAA